MNWDDQRCYLEEELLLHVLNDEHPDEKIRISNHLASCRSCKDVFDELVEAERAIRSWTVEDLPAESRESMKMEIMQHIRQDPALFRSHGMVGSILNFFVPAWEYAITSPIPAICFIGAVTAVASESAIEFFRLQPMMPSAGQVIAMLRKVI